jgi:hypothetical protein
MPAFSVSQVKENLDTILDEVQNTFEPIIIAGKNSSAVLVSEDKRAAFGVCRVKNRPAGDFWKVLRAKRNKLLAISNCNSFPLLIYFFYTARTARLWRRRGLGRSLWLPILTFL